MLRAAPSNARFAAPIFSIEVPRAQPNLTIGVNERIVTTNVTEIEISLQAKEILSFMVQLFWLFHQVLTALCLLLSLILLLILCELLRSLLGSLFWFFTAWAYWHVSHMGRLFWAKYSSLLLFHLYCAGLWRMLSLFYEHQKLLVLL